MTARPDKRAQEAAANERWVRRWMAPLGIGIFQALPISIAMLVFMRVFIPQTSLSWLEVLNMPLLLGVWAAMDAHKAAATYVSPILSDADKALTLSAPPAPGFGAILLLSDRRFGVVEIDGRTVAELRPSQCVRIDAPMGWRKIRLGSASSMRRRRDDGVYHTLFVQDGAVKRFIIGARFGGAETLDAAGFREISEADAAPLIERSVMLQPVTAPSYLFTPQSAP